MKLSREEIERVLGKQPPMPKIVKQKQKEGWSPTTREERDRIRQVFRDNPTYTMRELGKKFDRAPSVVWNIINGGEK